MTKKPEFSTLYNIKRYTNRKDVAGGSNESFCHAHLGMGPHLGKYSPLHIIFQEMNVGASGILYVK